MSALSKLARAEDGPARPSLLAVMVRLITHNLLACHAKGCTTNNFPLKLSNVKLALREADFNPDFLRGFLPRIEWDALIQASREVTNQSFSFHIEINQVTVLFKQDWRYFASPRATRDAR